MLKTACVGAALQPQGFIKAGLSGPIDRYRSTMNTYLAQGPAAPAMSPSWLEGWVTPANLPAYLAGVLALVGLIFAVRSSNASRRSAAVAQRSMDRMEEEREREQASCVAAWLDDSNLNHVVVRNGSDLPVFGVMLWFGIGNRASPRYWLSHRRHCLPPGDTALHLKKNEVECMPDDVVPAERRTFFVAVVFLDCKGRTWLRDSFGRLDMLTESRVPLYELPVRAWIGEAEHIELGLLLSQA